MLSRPVIAINKTYTLTSRSRLKSYKRSRLKILMSCLGWWSQRLGLVSGGEHLGLISVSSFYVSCPSLYLRILQYVCVTDGEYIYLDEGSFRWMKENAVTG